MIYFYLALNEPEEKDKLLRSLGPVSKVLLLSNHGAICCGETVEEAFYAVTHIVAACEAQLKLLPVGLDNLVVIPEETRKAIYDASRKPPEGVASSAVSADNKERSQVGNFCKKVGSCFEGIHFYLRRLTVLLTFLSFKRVCTTTKLDPALLAIKSRGYIATVVQI